MARPKARAAQTAERMLRAAIDEETAGVRAELATEKAEVIRLQGIIASLAANALSAAQQANIGAETPVSATPAAPVEKRALPAELAVPRPPAEEPIWHEPPIDLAGDDDLGPGRFI